MTKKILFCSRGTGGHIFPSVALTNFFSKKNYETMLVTDKRGEQYIKNNSLFYKTIDVVSSSQSGFMYKIFFYFKLIQAFFNSISLLRTEKPDIILGLGGYVSFPICLAARLLNIKILLYESNAVLGRTNKIFVRFCKKIFTNSENIQKLSKKYSFKSVRVGNILREEGNPDRALELHLKAVQIAPNNLDALYSLADDYSVMALHSFTMYQMEMATLEKISKLDV